MKKIAWLLVIALLFSVMPVSTGMEDVQAEGVGLSIEPTVTASSKYYEVKDVDGESHYPFVLSIGGLDQNCNYTVTSITVDNVDYKDKFETEIGTGDNAVTVYADAGKFLSVSEMHHIKVVIADENEGTFTAEKDFVLEPMQASYVLDVEETEYFSCTGVRQIGIKIDYYKFMTKSSDVIVNKVELTNQEGTVYGLMENYNTSSHMAWDFTDYRYADQMVRGNCYSALQSMVNNPGNICNIAFDAYSPLRVYTNKEIEPGFYNLVFTLSDGMTYTYRNAYEAVTRPIVYDIMDSSDSDHYEDSAILTDQTGDYVSIYVYGLNINQDTVKPVFYNANDEKISGDVKAIETGKWGAFFRIEKKTIPEDEEGWGAFYSIRVDETENEDWNIPLSTESYHKFTRVGYKKFDVKVELEEDTFEDQVQIARHEIIYQYYDQRDKTYTVYFAQNADVDTEFAPTLTFQTNDYNSTSGDWEYNAFVTVDNGTFDVAENMLTGQEEIKATFVLTDNQVELIKENSDHYTFCYGVSYKTEDGQEVEFRSDYNYAENCDVEDVPARGKLNRLYDTIFYLPYWIGGVHTIAANGQEAYYLTETDVQTLGAGKYAYASVYEEGVTAQNSSFSNRSYEYYFWKKGEPITPPVGAPSLTVAKEGEDWKFSWNSIEGATSYNACFKYGDAEITYYNVHDTFFRERGEVMPFLFQELFEECRVNPDESKMQILVRPMVEKEGDFAVGNASNVLTVAEIDSCKGANPDKHKGQTEVRGEVSATCGKTGYTGDTWCKDCNTKIATGTSIPTKAHKTVFYKADATKKQNSKYVCSVCKKEIKMGTTYYYPKSVTVSTVTYNGKSQTPKVVVKDSKGKTISSSHYSVSKVKSVGTSTITVTFKSSSAYYTGKLTAKCKIVPPKTTLKSVSAGSKKLTVKWTNKTGGVTGYEVQYSTSKSFKSVKTVTVKKGSTTSTTIKKLKGNKKYYVRVRVLAKVGKTTYKSTWSSAKSKTTKK